MGDKGVELGGGGVLCYLPTEEGPLSEFKAYRDTFPYFAEKNNNIT